jgi:quercetin dioxygenase-like cupin family protein
MDPINVDSVETTELTSSTTDDAAWVGGYFAYGGNGTDRSAVVYFAVPPGKRLGWHTDTAEETQFILSGSGELLLDEGAKPVRAGDVVVLTIGTGHDLRNTGSEDPARGRVLRRASSGAALDEGGLGARRPRGHRQPEQLGREVLARELSLEERHFEVLEGDARRAGCLRYQLAEVATRAGRREQRRLVGPQRDHDRLRAIRRREP